MQHDDDIRELLEDVGQRPEPPADMRERVYQSVHSAWLEQPAQSTRRSAWPRVAMSAAAMLLVVLGGWLVNREFGQPAEAAMQIVRSSGTTYMDREAGTLRTGFDGVVLVRLVAGPVLNVDVNSELKLLAKGRLRVLSGRVYVDAEVGDLVLETPHMAVRDIGTAYEVVVSAMGTQVKMREGMVEMLGSERRFRAVDGKGDTVLVQDGRVVEQQPTATDGEYWAWRQPLREPLKLNGQSVHRYLNWMARDQGKELRYSRRIVAQQAEGVLLVHGADITADDLAVSSVLEVTDFELVDQGHIWLVDSKK